MRKVIHELKIHPEYYWEVFLSHKTFEIRKNDRDFKTGDMVILKEWNPITKLYTGNKLARKIIYVLKDVEGLEKDFILMSIA